MERTIKRLNLDYVLLRPLKESEIIVPDQSAHKAKAYEVLMKGPDAITCEVGDFIKVMPGCEIIPHKIGKDMCIIVSSYAIVAVYDK
jgi:hypothetical protein